MTGKRLIKEILPPFIYKLIRAEKHSVHTDANYFCPVCDTKVNSFVRIPVFYDDMLDKYGFVHSPYLFETLNRIQYSCPHCGASDRNRLYALYVKEVFDKIKNGSKSYSFLDVAPDKSLASYLFKRDFLSYRSVDLYMEGVDDKADITDLNIYEDNKFDIILCSHVLEHIEDDRKAISELYRVMKKGGFGIFMVPILLSLDQDLENPDYNTPELHWKYYGQDDHVRMYSKNGFIEKLKSGQFKVSQLDIHYFGQEVFEKNGIHPHSVLYIVEK
ncbi:MAG: class I SAM-dependent methyltransferase [Dysgonomonas sp.]|nr:class I SAM-dependent methyltransferase [Dysgonomonas sp.]